MAQNLKCVQECIEIADSPHETLRQTYSALYTVVWSHYSYLKTGYFVLIESLDDGQDVWAAAKRFLKQLDETPSAQTAHGRI